MSEQHGNGPTPAADQPLTLGAVIARLAAADLTPPLAEAPLPATLSPVHDSESSPWYVKLLVGIAAWIAASFLAIFLGAAGLIDSWQSMVILGGVLTVGAVILKRARREQIFWGQLAFALILAGQGLLLAGVATETNEGRTVAFALIALEVVLFLLYPDALHRLLSLLAVVGALVFLLYDYEVMHWLHGLIVLCGIGTIITWQYELQLLSSRLHPFRLPLTYGFAIALFALCILPLTDVTEITRWWITSAGLALLLLYLAQQVLRDLRVPLLGPVGLWAIVALGILLIPAHNTPGILAATIVLLLGRWRSSGLILGLAVAFLLFFLSAYYYNLNLPLLQKSYILAGTGVVLLVARFGLHQVNRTMAARNGNATAGKVASE